MHGLASFLVILTCWAAPLAAQAWDAPRARALAERGTARRSAAGADTTLQSYAARAHGTVAFLAQLGEDLGEPPQLVKADELDVEVYWRAPGRSKQVIGRWRDGTWLPTSIHYHRDHLGIVVGNFGPTIRLGEGDEVRDVPHPLSQAGLALYAFRLVDSVAIRAPGGSVSVHVLEVRPRDPSTIAVLGELSLDAATGDLVRFRFGFTRAAYLDDELEDITVVLENTRWDGQWWLPWQQEIEIRRRSSWLDFPVRGIIRGRWAIGSYEFNVPVSNAMLAGPAIDGPTVAPPDTGGWERPLAEVAAEVAAPMGEADLAEVRREVARMAGQRSLSGLPPNRLGLDGVSDLVHVNRVEGVALGVGSVFGLAGGAVELRPRVGIGLADGRWTGGLTGRWRLPGLELELSAHRSVEDVGAWPVVSTLVNSATSLVAGNDHGDWVLLDALRLGVQAPLGGRWRGRVALEAGSTGDLSVEAEPLTGEYRDNAGFGIGGHVRGWAGVERGAPGPLDERGAWGGVSVEAGTGERNPYGRLQAELAGRLPAGPGRLEAHVRAGLGTADLPAWRSFAIGGRGTLVGEEYRAWGGRNAVLARLEWQVGVAVPAIPMGGGVDTGPRLVAAPFLATGWAGPEVAGAPWEKSDGVRPVAGVAVTWPHGLLRMELGVSLRRGDVGLTFDAAPPWWGIL